MDTNWIAIIVAVLGAGGIGAAIREIASVVSLARKGVSGREETRRNDIVAQRDHALEQMRIAERQADDADERADREADNRRRWQEQAARYRLVILELGGNPGPWPAEETTDPGRGTA